MFRRFFCGILLFVLFLSCLTPALAAGDMQQGSMYVNTSNGKALRFRSSKSTKADNVLVEIPYGTKVYVLSWDATWARIRYNSAVGYVVKKHLSISRPEDFSTVSAQRAEAKAAAQAEKELQQEIKQANAKLDHSKVKSVDAYDVTVITGVEELKAKVYKKASLTAAVITEYEEGVPLSVRAKNKDWAQIYNGADDSVGYMLLEDLMEDLVEEELLDDDQ